MRLRVRLAETDALGVVYYGQYLTYFDISRLEMLRKAGVTPNLLRRRRLGFVAGEARCIYHRSARFDDVLSLETTVAKIGSSSVAYEHLVRRGNSVIAEGKVTDVLVGPSGKPTSIPQYLRQRLERYSPRKPRK
jgi:acyl-CoA thioester hydrolase